MFKLAGLCLSLTITAALVAAPCTSVTIREDREIWINGQRVIRDNFGINSPRWSPDGQQLAYVNDFDLSSDPVTHIVVIDRAGHVVQRVPVPESARFNFVMAMGWLNPTTIWVEGHINPSVSVYEEFDLATREMKHETFGTAFSPSADGAMLAYRDHEPHPPRPGHHPALMINDSPVKLLDGVIVTGPLVWSPNGERLAVGVQQKEHSGVALVTKRGMLERVTMLSVEGNPLAIAWSTDGSLLVRPSIQNNTYRIDRDGTIAESKTPLRAAALDEACRSDRVEQ